MLRDASPLPTVLSLPPCSPYLEYFVSCLSCVSAILPSPPPGHAGQRTARRGCEDAVLYGKTNYYHNFYHSTDKKKEPTLYFFFLPPLAAAAGSASGAASPGPDM